MASADSPRLPVERPKAMIWTIPNMLTMARVAAAPMVAMCFTLVDRPAADWIAWALFSGAAATDFFDGWLARRLNQKSSFGTMLDPIADKAMIVISLFTLAALYSGRPATPINLYLVIPAAVILLREILVSGLREYLAGASVAAVTTLAKWKTTVQMIAIGALLLTYPLARAGVFHALGFVTEAMFERIGLSLLWLAALLTAITGWDYFSKGLTYINKRDGER